MAMEKTKESEAKKPEPKIVVRKLTIKTHVKAQQSRGYFEAQ